MKIISIDLTGKMAHFRKFYANNTALSYFIPPRTTMMGMLAALIGEEKESYYQSMASDRLRIGVRILCPLKKTFHRTNMLMIKGSQDFRGRRGRVQTPFELVSGVELGKDEVKYRLYISFFPSGEAVFQQILIALERKDFKYNLTFGTANFSASIEQFQVYEEDEFEVVSPNGEWVHLNSAICLKQVKKIGFEQNQRIQFEEEALPCDFVSDRNRELSEIHRVIYSTNEQPIPLILEGNYYRLLKDGQVENITFIE